MSTTGTNSTPETLDFAVEGMTCGSCAGKVIGAVEGLKGVVDLDVDLATGKLTVTAGSDANSEALRTRVTSAINAVGYRVA
ncbi:heavy-metal-associated domain-containing protein [Nocardioides deserti]|uniref:Heavy-metal-associated domain-containing protein n=1 Tax=Nocardioides deserti TaxID=1588644 RepID=A0ABR6U4Q2_9ACTN|nr:heavy metal-associated domain-containing protein [Nocardioides deserti]MBC2959368.1 heavy-metal-associated domain-containing protein [Nocardioides deserti]GGO73291.1 metal-binding protein [Nocardioides deserti]